MKKRTNETAKETVPSMRFEQPACRLVSRCRDKDIVKFNSSARQGSLIQEVEVDAQGSGEKVLLKMWDNEIIM